MFPIELNYKMPPEWHEHSGTFIEWPPSAEAWPINLDEARETYAKIAIEISKFETVYMLVSHEQKQNAESLCSSNVNFIEIESDDSWMRDNGPTFLLDNNQKIAGVNWIFNAWGEKYSPWDKDDAVASKLLKQLKVPCFNAPIVLEGGSIHVDGEGTLLTTKECLLNKNRNPHLSIDDIADIMRKYLNIEKIIFLNRGLDGDHTDGHIDNIACFASPGVVIMQTTYNKDDPNFEISQENLQILKKATDVKGRHFEVVEIEQPKLTYFDDVRLPLSYVNFYFVNGGIILPVFGGDFTDTDNKAINKLKQVFPRRKIVPVNGMPLIKGGGNVHCITQQMPKGKY